jgi:ETC complex I subunit conserved region
MRQNDARQVGIGHNRGPVWLPKSWVPEDVTAVIRQPTRSVMTSGKRRTREWVLSFERRTTPFIEALMGWTGGDDPMVQVELCFPTQAAAVAFGEREGLTYRVEGSPRASAARSQQG